MFKSAWKRQGDGIFTSWKQKEGLLEETGGPAKGGDGEEESNGEGRLEQSVCVYIYNICT